VENQNQVSHFPTASIPLSTKEQNRSAGGLRPPPQAALRSASVVSFYSAVVGNFLSALDRRGAGGAGERVATSYIAVALGFLADRPGFR
jgi:hypothetical protein